MLSDDVFRDRLEAALVDLEAWAGKTRGCADIDIAASQRYWRMSVAPYAEGACPFELMLTADQTFNLKLADEVFEDRPIERFDLFLRIAEAVSAGHVERIETFSALTEALLAIGMRVELAEGWDWIGTRRIAPPPSRGIDTSEERRAHWFLPYRR